MTNATPHRTWHSDPAQRERNLLFHNTRFLAATACKGSE